MIGLQSFLLSAGGISVRNHGKTIVCFAEKPFRDPEKTVPPEDTGKKFQAYSAPEVWDSPEGTDKTADKAAEFDPRHTATALDSDSAFPDMIAPK